MHQTGLSIRVLSALRASRAHRSFHDLIHATGSHGLGHGPLAAAMLRLRAHGHADLRETACGQAWTIADSGHDVLTAHDRALTAAGGVRDGRMLRLRPDGSVGVHHGERDLGDHPVPETARAAALHAVRDRVGRRDLVAAG